MFYGTEKSKNSLENRVEELKMFEELRVVEVEEAQLLVEVVVGPEFDHPTGTRNLQKQVPFSQTHRWIFFNFFLQKEEKAKKTL